MLEHPLPYVEVFRHAGADVISFHMECADDPGALIAAIKQSGAKAGIAAVSYTHLDVYKRQGYSGTGRILDH